MCSCLDEKLAPNFEVPKLKENSNQSDTNFWLIAMLFYEKYVSMLGKCVWDRIIISYKLLFYAKLTVLYTVDRQVHKVLLSI